MAAAAVFLALTACQLTGWPGPRALEVLSALFFPVLSLVFVPLAAGLAVRSAPGRTRAAWVAMTIALTSWALAEWIWAYYELVVGRTPSLSWADAAYLLSLPAMIATLLLFPSARSWRAQSQLFLDGFMLTASFFLISWLAVMRRVWEEQRGHNALELALALSYSAKDFLVVALGLLVLTRVAPGLRLTTTLLVAAFACEASGDIISAYSTHSADYTEEQLHSLPAAAAGLLIIVTLISAYDPASRTLAGDTSPRRFPSWLPLLPLLVAGVLVATAPNEAVWEPPVVITVGALIAATLIRQVLEAAESVRREREIRLLADRLALELDSAAKYVASILPAELDGPVEVSSRYLPSRAVGGDCFGYSWIDDDHLIFYLVDVSGHGVEPALLSVSVHNLLRSGSLPAATLLAPDQVLAELNQHFSMESHDGHYFTMWYGVYRLSTGLLRYASAGHPSALALTHADDTVVATELGGGSIPVGMFDDSLFTVESYQVPADTRILLYSDGVLGELSQTAEFVALCSVWASTPSPSLDSLIDMLPVADGDDADEADDRSLVLVTIPR